MLLQLKKHFNLKQIVKKATRKDVILDFVLTNMNKYYKEPQIFPPFGLSDHNTIIAEGQTRNRGCSTKVLLKRDKRTSRKAELGRYLAVLKWDKLFSSIETCEELVDVFNNVVSTGLNILMPIKKIPINLADTPWMTQHLKSLILKRQKAFHNHGVASTQYKFYRNIVNCERKLCKANFYKSKIEHTKKENPRVWWNEIKRICSAQRNTTTLTDHIQDEVAKDLSTKEIADAINKAFLEPLEEYRFVQNREVRYSLPKTLEKVPLENEYAEFPEVSEWCVQMTDKSIESRRSRWNYKLAIERLFRIPCFPYNQNY